MIGTETCECGHSWWEHHWSAEYDAADGCMECRCMLYSQAGSSCYWLVELYYEMEYPNSHQAMPCIESWIGEEIRYERARTKGK